MPMTRRTLLNAMAKLGGAGAVYETLAVWDFLKPPPAMAASLGLAPDVGRGKSVVILGAGVSGLCAAYELDQAGYDCIILEATRRVGGRSLTLRRGDAFKEMGDAPLQVCEFDEGLYLNAGPGRIPHHHTHVIHYCRKFGVALQPYIFVSRANLTYSSKLGPAARQPQQVRRYLYDLQGHVAELLDKCSNKAGLDQPLSPDDLRSFRLMLEKFGDLTPANRDRTGPAAYRNAAGRAGYSIPPGVANEPGKPLTPLALDEILRSNLWNDYIFRDMNYEWQTSLMEPVGGMDMFVKSFARQPLARQLGSIEGLIRYGAQVTGIEVANDNVTVRFEDRGAARSLVADFCVSTIPMPIFKRLSTNLPAAYKAAADNLPIEPAGKVGWQAERFWERDNEIYGGISWTTDDIQQIWYPSFGYLSPKGTLTGAYMYGDRAVRFNNLPLAERLEQARAQGEKLHPEYRRYVEKGVAVGWNRMEFEQMGWASANDPNTFGPNALILSAPQGRFHMAGDQITWWTGWQEGAVLAARAAVDSIHQQTRG